MPVGSTNPGPAVESTVNTQSPRGFVQFIQTIGVSLTPVAVATITTAEQSFGLNGASQVTAATGILPGDIIIGISPPSNTTGVMLGQARVDVATADKFYLQFVNPTAGSVTPPSGIYLVTVARLIQSVTTTPGTLSTLPSAIVTTS
jgi:hypothetical protein